MNQVSVCLMVIWSFQICGKFKNILKVFFIIELINRVVQILKGLMSLNVVRDNSNLLDQVAQAGVIESDQIIEGTRGKRISMRCLVKNVKNYKVSYCLFFGGIYKS